MKNLFFRLYIYELLLEREREMRRKTDVTVVVVDGGGGGSNGQVKNDFKAKLISFIFTNVYVS